MRLLICLFIVAVGLGYAEEKPHHADRIVRHAYHRLDNQGTLSQDYYGFVYVKVDDRYISEFSRLIQREGFEDPAHAYGAHITAIFPQENAGWIQEVDSPIQFTATDCTIIPSKNPDYESYCVIQVTSPELDYLRAKHNLPPLTTPYHITIGKKPKSES